MPFIVIQLLRDPEEGEGQAGGPGGEEGEGAQAKARGLEDEQVRHTLLQFKHKKGETKDRGHRDWLHWREFEGCSLPPMSHPVC